MRVKAFTLVELLVGISIIGLLIAILAPSLGGARESAKRAVCAANLSGLAKAAVVYANANKEVLPLEGRQLGGNFLSPDIWRGDLCTSMEICEAAVQCPSSPKCVDVTWELQGSWYGLWPGQPWDDPAQRLPDRITSYFYLGNGYGKPSRSHGDKSGLRPHKVGQLQIDNRPLFTDRVMHNDWVVESQGWAINHTAWLPRGSNQAFVGGDVQWVNLSEYILDPSYQEGNATVIHVPNPSDKNARYWWFAR
jgi:prepilin-type N-terminal cleavage/methylation domain-containing protein